MIRKLLLYSSACTMGTMSLHGDSFIYFMFSRRNFRHTPEKPPHVIFLTLPVSYTANNRATLEKHKDIGAIFDVVLKYPSRGLSVDVLTSYFNERASSIQQGNPVTASKTGLDDFLITAGYNPLHGKPTQVMLQGVVGIPTTWHLNPRQGAVQLVGNRAFSAGIGAEISFPLYDSGRYSLFGIIYPRVLHFFSRHFAPLIPRGTFHPGNRTDFLLALHNRINQHHFELVYYPTFFTNISEHLPTGKVSIPNIIINTLYLRYTFIPECVPAQLGFGLFGDFDSHANYRGFAWWIYGAVYF